MTMLVTPLIRHLASAPGQPTCNNSWSSRPPREVAVIVPTLCPRRLRPRDRDQAAGVTQRGRQGQGETEAFLRGGSQPPADRPTELLTLTPWLAPIVSEGTFDPELLQDMYQPLNLTIGVTAFAVGR